MKIKSFLAPLSTVVLAVNFCYADDSLTALQQDIIFAKQKQQIIAGKVSVLNSMLEPQKATLLETEAGRLIEDLVKKGYTRLDLKAPAVKVTDRVIPQVEIKTIKSEKKMNSPKKPQGHQAKPAGYGPPKFSEADALYRVAVSDKKVTLKEAVEIALAGNLELQALKKRVEVADAKLTESKRALFPTVQATVDYNGGINVGRFYKGASQKVNVNQPIFHGGELVFTVRQAEENLKASRAEYAKTRGELIHRTRMAFYGVVKAEYNAQYQFELYEKINKLYKRVQEEHRQKLISEVDALNAESQYHQAYFQLESSRNDLLSADLLLHQSLNLESDKELPIDLRLKFVKVEPSFDEILERSLATNPEIRIREYNVISSEYGLKIYQAKKLPRVDLRGSFGYLGEVHKDTIAVNEHTDNLDEEKEWFLGVHASMPLGPNSVEYDQVKNVFGPTILALTGSEAWRHRTTFNLFDKLSDITDEKSAEAAWLQSKSDYEKSKGELTVRLRDNLYEIQKSLIQIDASVSKMRYQEKQNAILEYLLGLQETSVSNFIEGLIQLAQSKFSFIQAVTEYDLALSGLSVAMGDPYYFDKES